MHTYINVLIGLLLGIIIYNMVDFNIIEGLSVEQEKDCNNTKNIISKNSAMISTMNSKLKSLELWLTQIAKSANNNTKRNLLNRGNIKRTVMVVKKAQDEKNKELEEVGEGL